LSLEAITVMNTTELEALFHEFGFTDFKWISAKDIHVAQWVRFHCMFGCPNYGKGGACPPNVPSVQECREMISEYSHAALIHLAKKVDRPKDRKPWSREMCKKLTDLEKAIFLQGYYKAFLMGFDSCDYCDKCPGSRTECTLPMQSRPGADALAVDVFATVRQAGYPIEVLKDYNETMNRYAFLLIE
jgi:predicted metal-binding protein